MPLDLKPNNDNLMVIFDVVSQTQIGIYYRTPKSSERIGYQSKMTNMVVRKKSIKDIMEEKIKSAEKFITGVRDGDLTLDGKPISSNKESENYNEDWLKLLCEAGSQVVDKFVTTLLGDGSTYVVKDDPLPFGESSNDS